MVSSTPRGYFPSFGKEYGSPTPRPKKEFHSSRPDSSSRDGTPRSERSNPGEGRYTPRPNSDTELLVRVENFVHHVQIQARDFHAQVMRVGHHAQNRENVDVLVLPCRSLVHPLEREKTGRAILQSQKPIPQKKFHEKYVPKKFSEKPKNDR